ncbi:hypothetical protein V8F06_000402 [Rhypophila decipiens]
MANGTLQHCILICWCCATPNFTSCALGTRHCAALEGQFKAPAVPARWTKALVAFDWRRACFADLLLRKFSISRNVSPCYFLPVRCLFSLFTFFVLRVLPGEGKHFL